MYPDNSFLIWFDYLEVNLFVCLCGFFLEETLDQMFWDKPLACAIVLCFGEDTSFSQCLSPSRWRGGGGVTGVDPKNSERGGRVPHPDCMIMTHSKDG